MTAREEDPLGRLSPALRQRYDGARALYIAAKHRESLALNQELRDQSRAESCTFGQILGLRFMGLCCYRLGELPESEGYFRQAIALANEGGEIEQVFLIENHLAATIRSAGRLDDAHHLLEEGLKRAKLPQYLHAHARFMGNLGALYDELGQRERADDCYARFEVLAEVLGNKDRLANARGLAARAAELRGDLELAEEKYGQERALALEVNTPLRIISATIHGARMAARRESFEEADKQFREALTLTADVPSDKRRVDALAAYGDFLRTRRDLIGAHRHLKEAEKLCREPEKSANVKHSLALVCREARLFGESLEYLMRSVEERFRLYEPLRRVRSMAQKRLAELRDLTDEVVHDAFFVARSDDERDRILKLVERVHGADAPAEYRKQLDDGAGASSFDRPNVLREKAAASWRTLLPRGDFDRLGESTKHFLVVAEISYSSAVDDFGRTVHLLAVAVERELRERIFDPVQAHLGPSKKPKKWMLNEILEHVDRIVSDPKPSPFVEKARELLGSQVSLMERIADLRQTIAPLRGAGGVLREVRNAVAHGEASSLRLDRLLVDAFKRALALETTERHDLTVLQALSRVRVDPSNRPKLTDL
jgi:tetratricopeptide (TPR) repeat protein